MKVEQQPCFVLHQRAYRETSLILDIFSLEFGRVSLVARGAKRGNKGMTAVLQPGRKLYLGWSIRSEMGTLVSAEPADKFMEFAGPRLFSCFYLNELLIRMLHRHESHPELFRHYELALTQLQQDKDEARILRMFEKNLLQSLGYGLILDHDADSGQPIQADRDYYYLPGAGPREQAGRGGKAVCISGRTLQALDSEQDWDVHIARESKQLFRSILEEYTGDKPLASRALYQSYLHYTGDGG